MTRTGRGEAGRQQTKGSRGKKTVPGLTPLLSSHRHSGTSPATPLNHPPRSPTLIRPTLMRLLCVEAQCTQDVDRAARKRGSGGNFHLEWAPLSKIMNDDGADQTFWHRQGNCRQPMSDGSLLFPFVSRFRNGPTRQPSERILVTAVIQLVDDRRRRRWYLSTNFPTCDWSWVPRGFITLTNLTVQINFKS